MCRIRKDVSQNFVDYLFLKNDNNWLKETEKEQDRETG